VRTYLPEEIIPESKSRTGVVLSFLLPAVVLIILNVIAYVLLPQYSANRGFIILNRKWDILESIQEKADLLILGDSSCNQGIKPSVLRKELGLVSYNLCTIGSNFLVGDSWMLDYYLQKHKAPRYVLITHVYDAWSRKLNFSALSQNPLFIASGDRVRPDLKLTAEERMKFYRNKFIPLYYQNKTLAEIIQNPLVIADVKSRSNVDRYGYMKVENPNIENVRIKTKRRLNSIKRKKKFRISKLSRKSLRTLIKLARKYDIKVLLQSSPLHDELYKSPAFQNYYRQVRDFMNSVCKKQSNFFCINNDPPVLFTENEMQGPDHVVDVGAEKLSRIIASKMKDLIN